MRNRLLSNLVFLIVGERTTLLDALRHIQKYGPVTYKDGICGNVRALSSKPATMLIHFQHLATSWPKHSGNRLYPVPTACILPIPTLSALAAESAYGIQTKWEGKYGQLRYELLDWCIKRLEKRHANATDKKTVP